MCDIRTFDQDPEDEPAPTPDGVHRFVEAFLLALTHSRVYSADHPRVKDSLDTLAKTLNDHLNALQTETLQLGATDGYLFFDQRPLLSASEAAPRLIQILARIGSGGVAFERGAGSDEFLGLAKLFAMKGVDELDVTTANLELDAMGAKKVRLLAPYATGEELGTRALAHGEEGGGAADLPSLEVPKMLYRDIYDHLTDVVTSVFRGHLFRLDETRGHVEKILQQLHKSAGAMMTASHYEHTEADQFQFRHSIRVACLALNYARGLTRSPEFLERVGTAALLHDIGKGRLEWSILHNPGRLSAEERVEMERHTEFGARLLMELEDCDPMAVAIAFGHHRTLDGGGYPDTMHTVDLSLATKLVKICDVYEALTARRPYKDPMSPTLSYRIMMQMNGKGEATHFDPGLLHRFILVNGIYPTGSWVKLDSGEVACVERQTGILEAPRVQVSKAEGRVDGDTAYFDVVPRSVDLRQPEDGVMHAVESWRTDDPQRDV